MDDRLRAFAAARGGVFTSAQARDLDVEEWTLRGWRRTGEVVLVRRGAHVLGHLWRSAGPEERLALRARAVLATRPGDVASHPSSLVLHHLPLSGLDTTPGRRHRAGRVLVRADGRFESPGETVTRTLLVDAGLGVRSQVEIPDPDGRLVGPGWRGCGQGHAASGYCPGAPHGRMGRTRARRRGR